MTSSDFAGLLQGRLPDDITVGEARRAFNRTNLHDTVQDAVEASVGRYTVGLVIRFVYAHEPPTDLPDEMTMGEFRALAAQRRARIIVEEGEGGAAVEPVAPVLVT